MSDNESTAESKKTAARQMGMPPEGEKVLVQGILPGDLDDFEYARSVHTPADATKGDEPGTIRRVGEK